MCFYYRFFVFSDWFYTMVDLFFSSCCWRSDIFSSFFSIYISSFPSCVFENKSVKKHSSLRRICFLSFLISGLIFFFYFRKEAPSWIFECVLNTPLLFSFILLKRVSKLSTIWFPPSFVHFWAFLFSILCIGSVATFLVIFLIHLFVFLLIFHLISSILLSAKFSCISSDGGTFRKPK